MTERTVLELRGTSCLDLEQVAPAKQQIMSSRSFGQPVHTLEELEQAVVTYTSRAAEKLRQQRSSAGALGAFIQTNPFKPDDPQYHPSTTQDFPTDPTIAEHSSKQRCMDCDEFLNRDLRTRRPALSSLRSRHVRMRLRISLHHLPKTSSGHGHSWMSWMRSTYVMVATSSRRRR